MGSISKILPMQIPTITSPTYHAMTQRNEKDLVKARKAFYERARIQLDLVKMGEVAGNIKK